MELRERIDLKQFLIVSLLVHVLSCLFSRNLTELLIFTLVYVSVLLSFYLLMRMVNSLIISQLEKKENVKVSSFSLLQMMFTHLFLLIFSLSIGVHFIGNRIIISLINYSIQIFVLGFALRKNLK